LPNLVEPICFSQGSLEGDARSVMQRDVLVSVRCKGKKRPGGLVQRERHHNVPSRADFKEPDELDPYSLGTRHGHVLHDAGPHAARRDIVVLDPDKLLMLFYF